MSSVSTTITTPTATSVPEPKVWLVNANHEYLSRKCPLSFHQIDPAQPGTVEIFTPQQVQLFFLFDREVRSGRATQAVPAGYANFASNYYAEGRSEAFAWVNSDGVIMGTDRKSVDPDILEIDMASCFTVKDFESLLPDGAKVLTPEEAKLFDRMLLMSAMRSVSHEERFTRRETVKRSREAEPGEVEDTEVVIKKMKFNKVKVEPVPKGKGKSEVRQLTEEELAAKKEKKAAKRARKANKVKSESMDVDV
ncbi:hypothetical protein B0H13DRAFT_2355623 [Mycena leptocephala]|nr:hypothetical protein B0H13DRAFT_2355623 [Mycena leptocephala]